VQRRLVLATFVVACGGGTTDDSISIDNVTPAFGPLSGGTRVTISGRGFLRDGAPPNRVVIGDIEAPLAAASDDGTLEVVTPPAEMAGDARIIVFNRNGQGTAMGKFHYSEGPTIVSVSPAKVVFDSNATVTVTGTGFKDENAGPVRVLVDGAPAVDVTVTSDTELSFAAPRGTVLSHATIEVINGRGEAMKDDSFVFTPAANPTLLIFTKFNPTTWAYFYDPVTHKVIPVANKGATSNQGFRASFTDANGDIWVVGRDSRFGKLDLERQVVESPITIGSPRINAMMRVNNTIFVTGQPNQFGTLDPATGMFTSISTANTMCCGIGLATNGSNTFLVVNNQISTLNTTNGARGALVTLNPGRHLGEMRFIGATLFGITSQGTNGDIVTIDPQSGTSTVVANVAANTGTMEVFQ
jgi:hypothetical protein